MLHHLILAAAAALPASAPSTGPLYLCRAPAWSAATDGVLAWQGPDTVVIAALRAGADLPRYLNGATDAATEWQLHDDGDVTWLRLSATLVLTCSRTHED